MSIHARISTIQGDAGTIDDAVKFISEKIMLVLHGLGGSTANFLADRSAGKPVAVASMPTKPRSKEASKRMTLSERGSRLDGTGANGSDQVRTGSADGTAATDGHPTSHLDSRRGGPQTFARGT
jgi:hypothetical protein